MGAIWAICRRDLIQHFSTPQAWLVLFVWLLLTNGVFYIHLANTQAVGLSAVPLFDLSLQIGGYALVLLAPALTMHSFSSERQQHTEALLFTLPISDRQIVLGKFAAACGMLGALVLVTLIQPVLLYFISSVPSGPLICGYLGLLLATWFFAALGIWISALVDSAVAAYVITMGLTLVLFLVGALLADPSAGIWPPLSELAAFVSLETRLTPLRQGIIRPADIAYLLAITAICLQLAHGALRLRREHG